MLNAGKYFLGAHAAQIILSFEQKLIMLIGWSRVTNELK